MTNRRRVRGEGESKKYRMLFADVATEITINSGLVASEVITIYHRSARATQATRTPEPEPWSPSASDEGDRSEVFRMEVGGEQIKRGLCVCGGGGTDERRV